MSLHPESIDSHPHPSFCHLVVGVVQLIDDTGTPATELTVPASVPVQSNIISARPAADVPDLEVPTASGPSLVLAIVYRNTEATN